jgi:small subunit ribosomal protein S9
MDRIQTIGRRKCSVARIYMTPGKGKITINKKPIEDYFASAESRYSVNLPFITCDAEGSFDVNANVVGGGITGQADAIKLAIARALVKVDDEQYRPMLKTKSLLTRDPRMVERKKPGQPKARKKRQFSKR